MKKYLGMFLMMTLALGISTGNVLAADAVATNAGDIQQKLNQVLVGQTEIIRQLQEIKAELQIVKVRASLKS